MSRVTSRSTASPFRALGLPERPDLTDEQVRAAWRKVAAATHPDRRDGGDIIRYTAAASAYAVLRTGWGRSEAFADLDSADPDSADEGAPRPGSGAAFPVPVPAARVRPGRVSWLVRQLPARIRRGRSLRLLARALVTYLLALAVLNLVPGQPAAPALITGLITWFLLTSRSDLAPPQER